jgi:chromosome segregation ATPase
MKTKLFSGLLLIVAITIIGALRHRQSRARQAFEADRALLQSELQDVRAEHESSLQSVGKLSASIADHEQTIHDLTAENERLQAATQTNKEKGKKGGRDDKHIWAAWHQLQAQVEAGDIDLEEAERRMGAIKEENEGLMRELRAAVAAGELNGKEARAKWAEYKDQFGAAIEEK